MRMALTNFENQTSQQRQEMLQLKADLEIEREWRKRLELSNKQDRATLENLARENEFLRQVEKVSTLKGKKRIFLKNLQKATL